MSNPNPADDVRAIHAALVEHVTMDPQTRHRMGLGRTGFAYPKDTKEYWVKFELLDKEIRDEGAMQAFLYDNFAHIPGIQIPKVHLIHQTPCKGDPDDYHPPSHLCQWTFIVMDYIQGCTVRKIFKDKPANEKEAAVHARVASRIATGLLKFTMKQRPDPTDKKPGPLHGGRMSYLVWDFDDPLAPADYQSVEELEVSINSIITKSYQDIQVNFSCDAFGICFGDIHETNFLIEDPKDPESTITIIDFQYTNFLPVSFLLWELNYKKDDGIFHSYEDYRFFDYIFTEVDRGLADYAWKKENIKALNYLLLVQERSHRY